MLLYRYEFVRARANLCGSGWQFAAAAPALPTYVIYLAVAGAMLLSMAVLVAAAPAAAGFGDDDALPAALSDVLDACPDEYEACLQDAECAPALEASFDTDVEPPDTPAPDLLIDLIQCYHGGTSDGSVDNTHSSHCRPAGPPLTDILALRQRPSPR
jgi:hypothetical protein